MSYPIMLNLQGKSCVIIGGGKVASRKVSHLLETGAKISVISPEVTETLHQWHEEGRIRWIKQTYQRETLLSCEPTLVFATTNSATLNQKIQVVCTQIGVWCNRVDDPQTSDFHNMAAVNNPPITIAISTHGASPSLLKHIKSVIGSTIGDEYGTLASWLKNLRERIALDSQSDRKKLYDKIVHSDILDLLKAGRENTARERFEALVEETIS